MAYYEVTLNQENLQKGEEVQVHGLGVLVNGQTVKFDKDQVDVAFRNANPVWDDGDEEEGRLPGYVPGQTLKQAAKSMPGEVEVNYVSDKEITDQNLKAKTEAAAAAAAKAAAPPVGPGQPNAEGQGVSKAQGGDK
jgi:hypothetical protein